MSSPPKIFRTAAVDIVVFGHNALNAI